MFNTDNFKETVIEVSSNNSYDKIEYNVWYYVPADAYTSTADLKIDLG